MLGTILVLSVVSFILMFFTFCVATYIVKLVKEIKVKSEKRTK